MKTIFKILVILGILQCGVHTMSAALPDVHVNDRLLKVEGKYSKVAYSDVFSTEIYGQNVNMRIVYSVPVKNNPAIAFEILTQNSIIYRNLSEYVNTLTPILKKFNYTGRRISDIIVKEKNHWMLASKYGVAGVSLGYVSLTYDDLSPNREDCAAVTFPLSFMDSNRYNYDGKNHWKDMLAVLCSGDCQAIEYQYQNPETKKTISVTFPVTAEMALVIQRVVQAYNNK